MRRTVLAALCWISLTLAALLVVPAPSFGAEPTSCPGRRFTTAAMFASVEQVAPDFVFTDLTGTLDGAAIIYGFNITPPLNETVSEDAEVYYFEAVSKGDEIYLTIVEDGCQVFGVTIYRDKFLGMIEHFKKEINPGKGADLRGSALTFLRALISDSPATQGFDSPLLHQPKWYSFVLNLYTNGALPEKKITFSFKEMSACMSAQVHWSQAEFGGYRNTTIDSCKEEE